MHRVPKIFFRACEGIVASGSSARRTERSDETYREDRRGASTAQRRNRAAQQMDSRAMSERAWVQLLLVGIPVLGLIGSLLWLRDEARLAERCRKKRQEEQ